MKKVIIASKNPVKIEAVKIGFNKMFPGQVFDFEAVSVSSDVPDQPMGDLETYNGAFNRAKNAQLLISNADFWVGLEGGLIEHKDGNMEAMAWIIVLSKNKLGKSRTAGFDLPQKTIALIKQGLELGAADEQVFGVNNSKQQMGSTGLLTDNALNRCDYYVQSVILALIPFLKTELY